MLGWLRHLKGQKVPPSSRYQHIMWPKIWLHCALWPSCAKQQYWRTCGQGPCWDHTCWCPWPSQEILQTGCPCEPVQHGLRGSALLKNQTSRWQSGGEGSYRESRCRRTQRSLAQETLHCRHRSRRGSESEIMTRNQNCWRVIVLWWELSHTS